MAVDRQLFADTVFLGAALPVYGPITPANKKWFSPDAPQTPHDPAGARALLASIGLTDRNGDGMLEDASQTPVALHRSSRRRAGRGSSAACPSSATS